MPPTRDRLWLFLVALLPFCFSDLAVAQRRLDIEERTQAEDRYWALLSDGTTIVGRNLRDWWEDKHPSLEGKKLFDQSKPLLLFRDTTTFAELDAPYAQLANGDILPGQILHVMPADPSDGLPQHAVFDLLPPLGDAEAYDARGSHLQVRADQITRLVLNRRAPETEPGMIAYADGRRVRVKAIRWTFAGVKALTESGSLTANFTELSAVHLPSDNAQGRIDALVADVAGPTLDSKSLVGRMVCENGAVFTYRRAMLKSFSNGSDTYHVIQPAWALAAMRIPTDVIVSRSYRQPDEIPLSLLPARTLREETFTGYSWPWRVNANVRGRELACGDLISDLGIGTHSYSEVAFDLPPKAEGFSCKVGIDRVAGDGGCVKLEIYRDSIEGPLVWKSGFVRGGDEPLSVKLDRLEGAERLVLVTKFGHETRPSGADPADIRDVVSWLFPVVRVDLDELRNEQEIDLAAHVPQLTGWEVSSEEDLELFPYWHKGKARWLMAMGTSQEREWKKAEDVIFSLSRRAKIAPVRAWLEIAAAKDDSGREGHTIGLHVDGQHYGTYINGDLETGGHSGRFEDRHWSFGKLIGKEVELTVRVKPRENGKYRPHGVLWGELDLGPLVAGIPFGEYPIEPDVPLSSLEPVSAKRYDKQDIKLTPGKDLNDKPLTIHDMVFDDGYSVETDTKITYELKPQWRRFVAVIGLSESWQPVGPYEVHLDGEVVWSSEEARGPERDNSKFGRGNPAEQVIVEIPPGHKTISLTVGNAGKGGAWANPGFMLE